MTNQRGSAEPPLPLPITTAPGASGPRAVVITGSYGAGHDSAAREVARVLRESGCEVEVHDIVKLLPWRAGRLARSAYYRQLRLRPESWGTTLRLVEPGRRLHGLATRLMRLAVGPVVEVARGCDLVVTTHPFAAQAVGHARATGRLAVPAVTYLTDASVHSLWVHPGVDLHLAIHPLAAAEARHWGGRVEVVKPLVDVATPVVPGPALDPLTSVGVVGPRALVTGGSLGIGDLEGTCRDILETETMTPVVLCGTDERVRRRLGRIAGVVALGWRDDVPALLGAADCVVQNSGGFTSLQALASGAPVITYRPLAGHGRANARNLEAAGLVPWARDTDDLTLLLTAALRAPRVDRLPSDAPDVATLLVGSRHPALVA